MKQIWAGEKKISGYIFFHFLNTKVCRSFCSIKVVWLLVRLQENIELIKEVQELKISIENISFTKSQLATQLEDCRRRMEDEERVRYICNICVYSLHFLSLSLCLSVSLSVSLSLCLSLSLFISLSFSPLPPRASSLERWTLLYRNLVKFIPPPRKRIWQQPTKVLVATVGVTLSQFKVYVWSFNTSFCFFHTFSFHLTFFRQTIRQMRRLFHH